MKKDIFTAYPDSMTERSLVNVLLGGGNPLVSNIKRRRNGDVVVCLLHPDGNKSQVVLHPYVSELGALSLNMTIEAVFACAAGMCHQVGPYVFHDEVSCERYRAALTTVAILTVCRQRPASVWK